MAVIAVAVSLSPSGAFSTVDLPADPADPMADPPTFKFLGVRELPGRQAASGLKYVAYFCYDDGATLVPRTIEQAPINEILAPALSQMLGSYVTEEADQPFALWLRS